MVYIADPENCCRAKGKSLGTRVHMAKPWVSWVWRDTLVFVAKRLRVGRDYHVRIYKAATAGLAPVYRIKHNQTIIQAMVSYSHQFMLQSLMSESSNGIPIQSTNQSSILFLKRHKAANGNQRSGPIFYTSLMRCQGNTCGLSGLEPSVWCMIVMVMINTMNHIFI